MKKLWQRVTRFMCWHANTESTHDVIFLNGVYWHNCVARKCIDCGEPMEPRCPPQDVCKSAFTPRRERN